ncbi:hypothetical protein CXF72_04540 [Psychromonas sp. MB-3u-54]|uniref:DUF3316 domain-containing protein n=1 Tax=Psychromonas sp. MB-3u-54 TaxID=2058319 RepID=UPI000C32B246|nr:DUF3316 domain-containing protein [Psychromonas sp. MB-3u-54]PKH03773.1 hypothetical protein CXF72_04540 [Psychromonas sp. MB-3u-54]
MKSIKNVLLASAMVILSANVFAGAAVYGDYGVHHDSKVIKTQAVETKAAAYSLGLEKSNQLESESGSELSNDLALFLGSSKEKNSITLNDNTFITVQESLNAQGDMTYSALVNVTYSYSQAN